MSGYLTARDEDGDEMMGRMTEATTVVLYTVGLCTCRALNAAAAA